MTRVFIYPSLPLHSFHFLLCFFLVCFFLVSFFSQNHRMFLLLSEQDRKSINIAKVNATSAEMG